MVAMSEWGCERGVKGDLRSFTGKYRLYGDAEMANKTQSFWERKTQRTNLVVNRGTKLLQTKIDVKTIYLVIRKRGEQKPIESVIMIIARRKPPPLLVLELWLQWVFFFSLGCFLIKYIIRSIMTKKFVTFWGKIIAKNHDWQT